MRLDVLPSMVVQRLRNLEIQKQILILGSAPQAPEARAAINPSTIVCVLNNAWRAVPSYDHIVYSDDFPDSNKPHLTELFKKGISSPQYWPAMNNFGGLLFCGATIAFAAAYWVIATYPCSQVTFFGASMNYDSAETHFYGIGSPDPCRKDPTLQSLEAKTCRLFYMALKRKCLLLDGSELMESRLCFPKIPLQQALSTLLCSRDSLGVVDSRLSRLELIAAEALALEKASSFDAHIYDYGCYVEDPAVWAQLRAIDTVWLSMKDEVAKWI